MLLLLIFLFELFQQVCFLAVVLFYIGRSWFEVFGAPLSANVEAVNLGLVKVDFRRQNLGVVEQEDVRQAGSKIGPVNVDIFVFWEVSFLAAGTVDLYPTSAQFVTHTDGNHFLSVAKSPWTSTIQPLQVVTIELSLAQGRLDVSPVEQAIEVACILD